MSETILMWIHLMLRVGITGGIGTGKTTVCRVFETLNIPVFNADEQAKDIIQSDEDLISEVKLHFGDDVYEHGLLNRKKLADIVFHDPEKLETLNAIVHPAVFRSFESWVETNKDAPYVLHEAALIFEAGGEKALDKVVVVTAPEQLRIQRIIERDNLDAESVKARMKNQWPEEEKMKRADFIVQNDETTLVIPHILHIHHELLKASATK